MRATFMCTFAVAGLVLFTLLTIVVFNGPSTGARRSGVFRDYSFIDPTDQQQNEETKEEENEKLPLILFYNDEYYSEKKRELAGIMNKAKCEWKCIYTQDKSKWNQSRTVIIREQFPRGNYPAHANDEQRVVLMLPEAPGRKPVINGLKKIPRNYINLTWGYMQEHDFYKPYDAMIKQKTSEEEWLRIQRILISKTKSAFIVFSNCQSDSKREQYIEELQKYFPVDTFGRCGKEKCDQSCMKQALRDYHFYIAFENNVCEDYFTEKFFHIKDLILPIVLKDSVYRQRVPQNSYIAIDQFGSPRSLANYLQHLMHNSTAYIQHFQWAREHSLKRPSLWTNQFCKVCQNAHMPHFHKVYEDISEFFGPGKRCDNGLVERLLEREVEEELRAKFFGGSSEVY